VAWNSSYIGIFLFLVILLVQKLYRPNRKERKKSNFQEASLEEIQTNVPPRVEEVHYLARLPVVMRVAQQVIITQAAFCLRSAPHDVIYVGLNQQLCA
jgi:hypothetical protein